MCCADFVPGVVGGARHEYGKLWPLSYLDFSKTIYSFLSLLSPVFYSVMHHEAIDQGKSGRTKKTLAIGEVEEPTVICTLDFWAITSSVHHTLI